MPDKLPPIYVPTSSGRVFTDDSGSVYESVDAYVRAADAALALDVPISDVVKYEPAVPRCKTCPMFRTPNPPVAHGWKCARLAEEFHVLQDGSGYCSNHPDAKP